MKVGFGELEMSYLANPRWAYIVKDTIILDMHYLNKIEKVEGRVTAAVKLMVVVG